MNSTGILYFRVLLVFVHLSIFIPSNQSIAQDKLYANQFPLADVILTGGPFQHARDLNIKVLLEYKTDRLLSPYLKQAGLIPKDSGYDNWDGLDGHIGGHYLSALAINAANQNAECRKRMNYMLDELEKCQQANTSHHPGWGVGYVGGVPNSAEIWTTFQYGDFKAYKNAWVPWYNLHKTFAGLRDAWLYGNSEKAKIIFLKFCDWAIDITKNLSDKQMQAMLDTEHGGMNEVLADAFQITSDKKYLVAARRFSHQVLLDPMSQSEDNLDNKHANTQVPKAIGFERIGELSGDKKYADAGKFFWQTVVNNRSLAFGGNSRREHFPADAACTDFIDDVEGPESCNSYNMLKLTEDLFRMKPSVQYIDYYEKTLYNHILATQHPVHGGYVYFTPARPRHYKVYSAPNKAMWCCVGSGMENHGKYNEFIYLHQQDSLFINLFVAAELNWREKKIKIRQVTNFPYEEKTKLMISDGTAKAKLLIRYPSWVAAGALAVKVNGIPVLVDAKPGAYLTIDRTWKKGDVIEVELPMHNTIEKLINVPSYIAILHGPILLGAKTGSDDLSGLIADDSRWAHIASGKKLPLDKAPIIIEDDVYSLVNSLVPVKNKPLSFTIPDIKLANPTDIVLEPYYSIHDARYMMYWMALSNVEYKTYLDSLSILEKEKQVIAIRTVDHVSPGEQQPEVDHIMQENNSVTGINQNQMYRAVSGAGYFSYRLATNKNTRLSVMIRYWGAEWGNRKFDIYIDDQKLLSVDNTGKWNKARFFEEIYDIPTQMLLGKEHIRLKFQSTPGNTAGGIYDIRLLKADNEKNK